MTLRNDTARTAEIIRQAPLLSDAPAEFVEALAQVCALVEFEDGAVIAARGAPLGGCYFVMDGAVELIQVIPPNHKICVDRLRPGARFGEACLYEDPTAEYDCIAGGETSLLLLPQSEVKEVLARFADEAARIDAFGRIQPIYAFLSKLPMFRSLSNDRLRDLAGRLQRSTCDPGQVLMREGEEGDHVYIVEKGSLEVYREASPQAALATLRRGDVIGEMALLDRGRRSASVRATTDAVLLQLARDDFLTLLNEQEDLYRSIRTVVDERRAQTVAPEKPAEPVPAEVAAAPEEVDEFELAPPAVKPPLRFGRYRYPHIRQQSQMDCSAACLCTICMYYGTRVGLNRMRELIRVGRSGASMTHIIRAAGEVGFDTSPYKSTWEQLQRAPLPAITNWNGYHWIVVYRVDAANITVADPALGRVDYSREEFEASWTRYTLFVSPIEKFKELDADRRSFRRFLPHILEQKKILSEVLLASLAMKFFAIFLPLLNMHIIDNVLMKGDMRFFLPSVAAVVVLTILQIVVMYFRRNLMLYAGKKISLNVLSRFYQHLLSLPLPYFESRTIGDVATRFGQNDTITGFLTDTGFQIFLDLLTALVVSILFFNISPVLMLITFALIMADVLQVYLTSPAMQRNFRDVYAKMAAMQSHFIESLCGMRTLKTLGSGHLARWKYENLYTDYMNTQLKGEMVAAGIEASTGFISSCTNGALIFVGAFLIFDGRMTIGALVAFLSLVGYVRDPVVNIVRSWDVFQETLNAVERVGDIFDAAPEAAEDQRAELLELPPLQGNIRFDNVTFRYEEDAQDNVLQNISLTIPSGQKVAFVGRSGSGKSTLVKLIYGFYRANSGQLTVDGFDLRDCWLTSLRRQIGIVLQQDFMFSGTIRDNISRSRPAADMSEIAAAAKAAAAHDFISALPEGYETLVRDRGANFSGGQRQRLCLARTLLQNAGILILDEATSALDNESERFVMDNIYRQFQDRTVIMIAHRLSTVRNCDRIYVLDKGTIIEQGTHDDLMAHRGMYYLLNSRQQA